jgi:hypothetical protein
LIHLAIILLKSAAQKCVGTAYRLGLNGEKMTAKRQSCGFFTLFLLGGTPKIGNVRQ